MFAAELDARRGAVADMFRAHVTTAGWKVAREFRELSAGRLPAAFVVGCTQMRDLTAGKSDEKL